MADEDFIIKARADFESVKRETEGLISFITTKAKSAQQLLKLFIRIDPGRVPGGLRTAKEQATALIDVLNQLKGTTARLSGPSGLLIKINA